MELTNEQLYERYETLVEAVRFDTDKWEASNGPGKPRGYGGWWFSLESAKNGQSFKFGDKTVHTPPMNYAQAKSKAIQMFKEMGLDPRSIWVMP
jgi:aspartate aminotransferase-like enzyme